MATTRVRIQTYVDAPTAELVRETAAALDQTASALVADMISYGIPMLEILRDTALGLKAAPDDARARIAAMAEALRPIVDASLVNLDGLERAVTDPPPSNRGVRK